MPLTPDRIRAPLLYAAVLAGLYAVLGSTWIVVSDEVAALKSASVQEMAELELVKGLGFVAVTALLIFVGSGWALRLMAEEARRQAEMETRLLEAERAALPGVLAASIAHDFNNQLTVLHGLSGELELALAGRPEVRTVRDMVGTLEECSALAARLSRSGRVTTDPDTRSRVELQSSLQRVLHLFATMARKMGVSIHLVGGAVTAEVAESQLRQAVGNLVLNAVQLSPAPKRVEVRVVELSASELAIEVDDDGPGVPEALRDRIFEPFFTTKESGTGLGLLSVRAAAEAHGGRLELADSRLGGACFRLTLPRTARPAQD